MPSDIIDQRHMSSLYRPLVPSSFFSEEFWFPSEKQGGFGRTASMPDHHGIEAMSFMSRGKAVSSSPLEKIRPMRGNLVDCLEFPQDLFKDPKRIINFEHHLMGSGSTASCWRAPDQDFVPLSKLYGQPAQLSVEAGKITSNGGHYENGLFSNSMSYAFNNKLRLSSNDAFVGQSVNTNRSNFGEDEALEEIGEQTIRDLLPDDDDLFSGAIHDLGYVAQSNKADVEDDLFCSVGGMELESDDNFRCGKAYTYGGASSGQEGGSNNLHASELPFGEQPSRTLFVKNIDINIEDMELRVLFEQYGDIQTFYTSCRDRGFVMVSYYDIRAAQNAIRVLQTKSIRGRTIDIQFCISKEEKDISEGVLLVTNLESSMSKVDLLHTYGVYGEIKEITEIPHKYHQKYIEFYDVRDAEAALSAINSSDIAGMRINVDRCGLREERISSTQQLPMEPEEEKSIRCKEESYSKKLPSDCFVPSGSITLGANTSTGRHNGDVQRLHTAFQMQNTASIESNFHGISSSIPHNFSSPGRFAMVGNHINHSSNSDQSHSLRQLNHGFQSMPSFAEIHDGVINSITFNSASTMSGMAMNVNSTLINGIENRNRVGSGGHNSHSFEPKEAGYNVSGNRSFPLHGHEYIWSNSNTFHNHHPGSMVWQNLPPLRNNIPTQTPQVQGLARVPSLMPNPVLPPHQHVGSTPAVDPLFWDQRHTFTSDVTSFHSSSVENMGYGSSQLQSLELVAHNIFPHSGVACIDPSIAPVHVTVPSPQQRGHMFRVRNNVSPVPNSHDAPNDRSRSRRSDLSSSQVDSRKQYELDIDRIIQGEELRTTLMIKNIPNKYTSKMLLATIDEQHKGTYDFIYLPIDFKNKCNVGYAFINMTDPQHIIPFYQAFNGKKWEKFNSEKVAYLAYARIQGKSALIANFQNSSLMNEDKRCRPIIFHSNGPNAGDQEPFPVGMNIRSRRSRTHIHQGSPSGSSSGDESSNPTGSPSASAKDSE